MKVPLHKYTFKVRPVREWLECQCRGRVLNPGGRVITFGYHSVSMGKSRGYR